MTCVVYYRRVPQEQLKQRTRAFEAHAYSNSRSLGEYLNTIANYLTKVEEQLNAQGNLVQQNQPQPQTQGQPQPQPQSQSQPQPQPQPQQVAAPSQQPQPNPAVASGVQAVQSNTALRQHLQAQQAKLSQKQFMAQNPHLHHQQQFQLQTQQILLQQQQQQQRQQQLQQQQQQQQRQHQQSQAHQPAQPSISGQGATAPQPALSQQIHQPSIANSADNQNQSSSSHPPQSQGFPGSQLPQQHLHLGNQSELARKGNANKRGTGPVDTKVCNFYLFHEQL